MLLKLALVLAVGAVLPACQAQSKDWWETASFYQIYPRSFKDSNGDGVGDLKGVTEKLDYLKEIGVTATWLSPIFRSPMADFGYDISNFTDIDPLFGSMADFDNLVREATKKGIKIILDFVPNHTSDEHEWFQKSVKRDPYYKNFYVWAPGRIVNGVRQPPSNWVSVFRGSAWEWHPVRREYYLHQFHKKQPDLNFREPRVQQAMKEVLEFWLRKGAAGFRIDAVQHSYEIRPESDGNFLNEPRNSDDNDVDSYGYTQHVFTIDQRETTEMIYSWRKVMDDFKKANGGDTRILMAESYSAIEVVREYYGDGVVNGSQIPFNFLMLQWLNDKSNAYDYDNAINTWLRNMPKGQVANWVMGNHDKNRVGSRLGKDRMDLINTILATLPGCSITYQGEEIGMTDVFIPWEDTVDPQACNSNPDVFQWFSRDPARTPFQWNTKKNAGFSNADKTWLPVSNDYKTINVESERKVPDSHLNLYKELHDLRNNRTYTHGDAEIKAINQNVLGIKRSLRLNYTYITLVNIWDQIEFVDLSVAFPDIKSSEFVYEFVNRRSQHSKKDETKPYSIVLMPKEAVVLRSKFIEF